MEKVIKIGNKDVPMKANAFTPFAFKAEFGADLIKGMTELQKNSKNGDLDLEFVCKVAYIMAKASDNTIGSLENWLEGFEIFDLYEAFPEIIDLWAINNNQNSKPIKK